MAQISSTKCNICEKDLGKLFCYECQHFLCTSCKLFHEKFPAAKNHYVTESHNFDRATLSSDLLCEEHKLDFVHYCLTCELLTCSACVTSKHNGHLFTEVAEITAKARTVVSENLDILMVKLKNLSDLINRTKSKEIDFIKKESDAFIGKVNTISDDFIGIVNSVTEINITRATDYYETEKQGLNFSVSKLEKTHNEYQLKCTKLEQLLLQKHHVAFFNIHKSLIKELKELDNIPPIEEPLSIEQFKENDFTDLVIEKIQSKYEIRIFKRLIDSIRQEEEKRIAFQKTKEAELVNMRQVIKRLESEIKENTRTSQVKDTEIQVLKQSIAQEKDNIAELHKTKDTELLKLRKQIEKLETAVRQTQTYLKSKEKYIRKLELNLEKEKTNVINLQKVNGVILKRVRQQMQRPLDTEREQLTISVKMNDEDIQHLNLSSADKKARATELQQIKDAELDQLRKEKGGVETNVKPTIKVVKKKPHKMYIAIHLGDTQSDYCYSLTCDKCGDIKCFHLGSAFPTSLLLNEHMLFECFGSRAENMYTNLVKSRCSHSWHFFKQFLSTIDLSSNQAESVMLTSAGGGRQHEALTLCSMAVEFLLDHATQNGLRNRFGIDDDDLLQDTLLCSSKILTVPDRWTTFGKEFMLKVAKQVGIDEKQLAIVTESEAAYANVQHKLYRGDLYNPKFFEHGSSFIVLNFGDMTLDITVNQIKDHTSIKQIFNKHVNYCGWILEKEAFSKLMSEVFGKAIFEKWSCMYSDDSHDLYQDVEIKGRNINQWKTDYITIKVPLSFIELFQEEKGHHINRFISQSNYSCEVSRVADKLRIKISLCGKIWIKNNITQQVQSVLDVYNSVKINEIIIIGSVLEPVVVETLQKSFSDIDVYFSKQECFSITRGAALFGQGI